jgi:poly(A) polymerase
MIDIFSKDPILNDIGKFGQNFGMDCYVIGGYVRDHLLGRASKDIDILVIGDGIVFATEYAKTHHRQKSVAVYKNYGTASLTIDTRSVEFVGARKESYQENSRKPFVDKGTLIDDQSRRDFTINALAFKLNEWTGELVDPFNGVQDLTQKTIRTPLDPDKTFSDDPLRMMRAVRFACQLNFEINPETRHSIYKNRERIKIISAERIRDELQKIILSEKPSLGFILLDELGLLTLIFPEFMKLKGVETIRGKSHKDNFYHTLEVLDNVSEYTQDVWIRWAAILHDIAKPQTKRFDPIVGWTFHGHEDKGSRMVAKIFRNFALPMNEPLKRVEKLVLLHLRPIVLAKESVTDSAVRRLLFEAGEDIDALMTLCHADITTKNEYKARKYRDNFNLVRQKLIEVEASDQIKNWQPPISGNDIMELFSIGEGKEVGLIKNAIREAILDGVIPNKKEEALAFTLLKGKELGLKNDLN